MNPVFARSKTLTKCAKNAKQVRQIKNLKKHYTHKKDLGQGAYGIVSLATRKGTDHEVAIKKINKKKVNQSKTLKRLTDSEINALRVTSHPHIMNCIEMLEDNENYFMVCEILNGGQLYEYFKKKKNHIEEPMAKVIVR